MLHRKAIPSIFKTVTILFTSLFFEGIIFNFKSFLSAYVLFHTVL
jgi:hypothetical protein